MAGSATVPRPPPPPPIPPARLDRGNPAPASQEPWRSPAGSAEPPGPARYVIAAIRAAAAANPPATVTSTRNRRYRRAATSSTRAAAATVTWTRPVSTRPASVAGPTAVIAARRPEQGGQQHSGHGRGGQHQNRGDQADHIARMPVPRGRQDTVPRPDLRLPGSQPHPGRIRRGRLFGDCAASAVGGGSGASGHGHFRLCGAATSPAIRPRLLGRAGLPRHGP